MQTIGVTGRAREAPTVPDAYTVPTDPADADGAQPLARNLILWRHDPIPRLGSNQRLPRVKRLRNASTLLIHVNVRLEQDKLYLLVMIGVRADGRKELVALTDGYWESAGSWADLLRDCKRRAMHAPVLAAGDGALGFWSALREVFPETHEQRCWFHKISSVLAALPKSTHSGAKKAIAEIWNAEDKTDAKTAIKAFETDCGAKFPKAVAKIVDDVEALLTFFDFPGALGAPSHNKPDRIDLRDGTQPEQDHQRPRITRRGNRHGLQADRGSTVTLAAP
jgi:hypothetical protein